MRSAVLVLAASAALAAGCGRLGGDAKTTTATTITSAAATTNPVTAERPAAARLRVGVVGPLQLDLPGASVDRGTLTGVAHDPLVLVSAAHADAATVAAAADANPTSHFALVGGSTAGFRRPNLVGLVIRTDQTARLEGVVAAIAAIDQGGADARVAWVGPPDTALAAAFVGGVHEIAPSMTVLRAWSTPEPAPCKEAAIGAIARGAVVLAAERGVCAQAVAAGAHERNLPALRLSDFELPAIPAAEVARDAAAGLFRGDEDLVFGLRSGAIGVRRLDPRIAAGAAETARTAAQELVSGLRPSG